MSIKFKRFPRKIRDKVDAIIVNEAADGHGEHANLTWKVYLLFLEECGSIKQFVANVAATYVSNRKQILHKFGKVDIGANGITKIPLDMNDNDRHALMERRSRALIGDLIGAVKEARRYKEHDLEQLYIASLRALNSEAAEQLSQDEVLVNV